MTIQCLKGPKGLIPDVMHLGREKWSVHAYDYMRSVAPEEMLIHWKSWEGAKNKARKLGYRFVEVEVVEKKKGAT